GKFAISNIGMPSLGTRPAPGNCTATCLEFEFRTMAPISNDGENSTVPIWNGAVIRTEACPCCDGVSCKGAASKFGTSCNPPTVKEGEPVAVGRCCWEGVNRTLPSAPPAG